MRARAEDGCTMEEQQLFNNMCLLGLAGSSKSSPLAPEVTKFTFRKPSTKTLESVLYQLYAVVWGEAGAQKEFKNVFPVADSGQAKEFNQRISDWLKALKDSGHLEMNSISTASQLRTASGFRLVSTLLDLSSYALHTLYQRLHPEAAASCTFKIQSTKDPKQQQLLGELLLPASKAVAAMDVQAQAAEYARISRAAAQAQRREQAAAEQFRDAYYGLRARHLELCGQLEAANLEVLRSIAPVDAGVASSAGSSGRPGGAGAVDIAMADSSGTADPTSSLSGCSAPALPAFALSGLRGSSGGGRAGGGADMGGQQQPAPGPASEPERVSELLCSLSEQLQRYGPLEELLSAAVSATVHPNAVDGAALRRAAGVGAAGPRGGAADAEAATSEEAVDVVAMLHGWAQSLEACEAPMRSLAGLPQPPSAGWGPLPGQWGPLPGASGPGLPGRSGGVSAAGAPNPLVAPPNLSSSHAALLSTQLGLHRGGLQGLHAMARELAEQLGAADLRARELEPLIRREMAVASAAAAGGLQGQDAAHNLPQAAAAAAAAAAAGPAEAAEHQAQQQQGARAWEQPAAAAAAGLGSLLSHQGTIAAGPERRPQEENHQTGPAALASSAAVAAQQATIGLPSVGQDAWRGAQLLAPQQQAAPDAAAGAAASRQGAAAREGLGAEAASMAAETPAPSLDALRARLAQGGQPQGGGGPAASTPAPGLGAAAATPVVDVAGIRARLALRAGAGVSETQVPAEAAMQPTGPQAWTAQQGSAAVAPADAPLMGAEAPTPAASVAGGKGAAWPLRGAAHADGAAAAAAPTPGVDVTDIRARLARLMHGTAAGAAAVAQPPAPSNNSSVASIDCMAERGHAAQPVDPGPSVQQPGRAATGGRPPLLELPQHHGGGGTDAPSCAGPLPSPQPGLDCVWAMEIDSPSEEDIGAVLRALGCSPRTQAGLGGAAGAHRGGGGGVRSSRLELGASGVGDPATETALQPQQQVLGVKDGAAQGGAVGGLHDVHAQGQQQAGQVASGLEGLVAMGGALDATPTMDVSARRLTFSAAVASR